MLFNNSFRLNGRETSSIGFFHSLQQGGMVKTALTEKYKKAYNKMYIYTKLLFSFIFIFTLFDTQAFLAEGLHLGCTIAKPCPFCSVPEL